MSDVRAEYIDSWIAIFYTLLGWSPDRVLQWVDEKYMSYLNDPNDIFYHESPLYWAADTLISELIAVKFSSNEHVDMRRAILEAYWDLYHDMYKPPQDLMPFKNRMEVIVKQFHEEINGTT